MRTAVLTLAALLSAAPALATDGPAHSVRLAGAAPEARTVIRDVLWSCSGDSCIGSRSTSRPAIVCQGVVRQLGPVTAFSARGEAFDAAALERCNAVARR